MFSLPAYLARIGLEEAPAPDTAGLARLQLAHRLAIGFENLDVLLGRPIAIESAAVADKLLGSRRGGYCFEHGQLFLDALEALGFEARPLLARVWLGAAGVPPLTHTLALVTLGGQPWIADAGFGGSYTPPMPLADAEEVVTADGARHRLAADPVFGWMLSRAGDPAHSDGRSAGSGLLPQYSFKLDEVFPADLALSNHWVSTAPDSRFTREAIVSVVLPRGFASLIGWRYSRSAGDERREEMIDNPKVLRLRLSLMFGIDLTAEEVERLLARS
jgi:N-hydroxyarylamine O-acetyltransferase